LPSNMLKCDQYPHYSLVKPCPMPSPTASNPLPYPNLIVNVLARRDSHKGNEPLRSVAAAVAAAGLQPIKVVKSNRFGDGPNKGKGALRSANGGTNGTTIPIHHEISHRRWKSLWVSESSGTRGHQHQSLQSQGHQRGHPNRHHRTSVDHVGR
jgi:hypothetical protein